MSIAITYAGHVLTRCRALMTMQDVADRALIKAAIEDVVLDVCTSLVEYYGQLMEQHEHDIVRTGKLMRDLRASWRAIIKRVKAAHPTIAINERQLFCVSAAHLRRQVLQFPKALVADVYQIDTRHLMNCPTAARKQCIRDVLQRYTA